MSFNNRHINCKAIPLTVQKGLIQALTTGAGWTSPDPSMSTPMWSLCPSLGLWSSSCCCCCWKLSSTTTATELFSLSPSPSSTRTSCTDAGLTTITWISLSSYERDSLAPLSSGVADVFEAAPDELLFPLTVLLSLQLRDLRREVRDVAAVVTRTAMGSWEEALAVLSLWFLLLLLLPVVASEEDLRRRFEGKMSCLHMGHVRFIFSQGSMHFLWNSCLCDEYYMSCTFKI